MRTKPLMSGFYGKIPSRGDFVQKGLPGDLVRDWDDWLTAGMLHSQQVLGERWRAAFMTAPFWRCYLSAGVCGEAAVCGVMLPSVDRVGRTFPLLLCHAGSVSMVTALSHPAARWFERVEALAIQILEQKLEPEGIIQRLPEGEGLLIPVPERARSLRFPVQSWDAPFAGLEMQAMLPILDGTMQGVSVWWSNGSDWVKPSVLWCRGMPLAEAFPALLAGDWRQFGWSESAHDADGCPAPG